MKRYKIRFKTEEEFIKESGNNWRDWITLGWCDEMDEFVGKKMTLTDKQEFNLLKGRVIDYINSFNEYWEVNKDMTIIKVMKPSYKPKRIERVI